MQKDINLINDFEASLSKNLNYLPKYELISLKKKLQNIKKNKKKNYYHRQWRQLINCKSF